MAVFLTLLCSFVAATFAAPPDKSLLSAELQLAFRENLAVNIFITLTVDTSPVLSAVAASHFLTRENKLQALQIALMNHTRVIQQPILSFLSERHDRQRVSFKSFWITNQLYIPNATLALVSDLVATFPYLIASIDEEMLAEIPRPISVELANLTRSEGEVQWGIEKIQAPEAWKELGKELETDHGILVATIDTGVRGTHEALRDNFIGEHGWFDPRYRTTEPTDTYGHGTHTTGTIAGKFGIGVSPHIKWSACRGCTGPFCEQSSLLACGEFFICPDFPVCSLSPHVISNSWGGGRGSDWYDGVIEAWHVAEIIPVFSIGNGGPVCDTPSSPGDSKVPVIAVGATTATDAIASYSSLGPTMDLRIKPEISAPGDKILSAGHTADNEFVIESGSSMSAPHVSGVIALLKIRNKQLTYHQVLDLLVNNADRDMRFSGRTCGGIKDNVWPNPVFGSGRVNALRTLRAHRNG